jgi:hypothetical protein
MRASPKAESAELQWSGGEVTLTLTLSDGEPTFTTPGVNGEFKDLTIIPEAETKGPMVVRVVGDAGQGITVVSVTSTTSKARWQDDQITVSEEERAAIPGLGELLFEYTVQYTSPGITALWDPKIKVRPPTQ